MIYVLWLKINRCGGDGPRPARPRSASAPGADGNTTNKDGGVGIAGRDIQVIDPDLVVGTAIVGVDSCFNDQRGLTFSNGPGVAGVCPTAAIAANDIAGTGLSTCVFGEIRTVKVVAPESATRIATISVTIQTQEPSRGIDRVPASRPVM